MGKEILDITLLSIGEGIIATDTNGKVILMDEVAERLTGWLRNFTMRFLYLKSKYVKGKSGLSLHN